MLLGSEPSAAVPQSTPHLTGCPERDRENMKISWIAIAAIAAVITALGTAVIAAVAVPKTWWSSIWELVQWIPTFARTLNAAIPIWWCIGIVIAVVAAIWLWRKIRKWHRTFAARRVYSICGAEVQRGKWGPIAYCSEENCRTQLVITPTLLSRVNWRQCAGCGKRYDLPSESDLLRIMAGIDRQAKT